MLLKALPAGILIACNVFLADVLVAAKQQCRLQPHNKLFDVQSPFNIPSPTPTTSGGSPASGTSMPTRTPFNYGKDLIRGVNLGGWFVLEPWITPSIFQNTNNTAIVDEYTLGQMLDPQTASSILQQHWETWITEDDFAAMAAAGLNHVRIPVGYWSVPLTSSDTNTSTSTAPYVTGAWPYLLKALNWAAIHNIHVILDIHGAPGSQNGYDNSGQRTANYQWAWNAANVTRTIDTVRFIAENIGGMIDVLELLNEPAGFTNSTFASVVRQYWLDGYSAVRDAVGNGLQIMIGDAFLTVDSWEDFLTYPGATGVIMDYHEYQIFSNAELARTFDEHVSFACSNTANLAAYAASNIWTIVGEWSNALTDCAQWLNGRGVGARWDGSIGGQGVQVFGSCAGWTGNSATFSDDYKTMLRKYWELQVEMGESVQGWIFWTWRAENADEWSYSKGLEGGWIPQDPTQKMFPKFCS